MEVGQASSVAAASGTKPAGTGNGAGSKVSSDFETFLKMLTAQLENQDPLNPVESADFAVQLATFSGVEQQVRTNELLEGLAAGELAQFASWVGMEARVAAPAYFSGQPITVHVAPAPDAERAQLVVRDSNDAEIQRIDIATTAQDITWAGVDGTGNPLASGTYTFKVESFSGGKPLRSALAQSYVPITETRLSDGTATLLLASGAEVSVDAVSALRNPGG